MSIKNTTQTHDCPVCQTTYPDGHALADHLTDSHGNLFHRLAEGRLIDCRNGDTSF